MGKTTKKGELYVGYDDSPSVDNSTVLHTKHDNQAEPNHASNIK